jgi:peptide subunit release factor 1 (eRF1)
VRSRSERTAEAQDIQNLEEGIGTGWAVNGLVGTLAALAQGQVRTLLVDPLAEQVGVRCRETGRLALAESDCDPEGGGDPIPDLVDEAIEEALRQGGHIDVVEDDDLRAKIDGVAALFRFVAS